MMKTAQERIHEYMRFGSKPGLERIEALCSGFGDPQKGLRVIHVAGTNGKGSVCHYIYEALRALGYTAGIFTSPYVSGFSERIEANGETIAEERLEALTDRVLAVAETLSESGDPPTEFEVVTAIGLAYFAEESLDFVVLEVGLGGRGDSTNIVEKPVLSIITNVALDHMDVLGDTLEEIAWEKAGIIKAGCPVITGATGEAFGAIAKQARELGAPLIDVSRLKYRITERTPFGYTFDTAIGDRHYRKIELSMAGEHQVKNAVTALCALDFMREEGLIQVNDETMRWGMKAAHPPARFQIVSENPLVVFDGAHNPDGARALAKTLGELVPGGRILFVCSILRDKAVSEMLEAFAGVAAAFVVTTSGNERSLGASALAAQVRAAGGLVAAEAPGAKEAYNTAMGLAGGYDAVVFAGSLYMIGDILQDRGQ